MNKLVSGALVGVVAFVVLAPVIAWIMPKSDSPAPDAPADTVADDNRNPFVPLPMGESSTRDESPKEREDGRGMILFDVKGDDDEDDEEEPREWRKGKHRHWRDD